MKKKREGQTSDGKKDPKKRPDDFKRIVRDVRNIHGLGEDIWMFWAN